MSKKRKRRKRSGLRVRRMTAPGASPGTVAVRLDAKRPVVRVMAYGPDELLEHQVDDLERLPEYCAKSGVTWVNIDGLGDAATIERIGELFGLHALALEDVVNVHQRVKVEEYGDHLFIVARMVSFNGGLDTEQISMFLGENFMLTFQERSGDCLDPVRERLRRGRGRIRKGGADYLLYASLDAIVDAYFPVVDAYGERLEMLDDTISSQHAPRKMHDVHEIRSELMVIRRAIRPMRDALLALMPDPTEIVKEETHVYFRDCFDHVAQLMDLLDTYREMCSDLRDLHLSSISNRMNEIMKVLTIIATIFIPLSFIAGVYGMNFKHMPELEWQLGYPLSIVLMFSVAGGLLTYFWRCGWIGATDFVEDDHPNGSA
jgi:magnesium transporter